MNVKIKNNIFLAIMLLCIFVIISFFDSRSGVLGEITIQNFSSISVAISFLKYNLNGFVGLIEVFNVLSSLNSITEYSTRYLFIIGEYLINFENVKQLNEYDEIITKTIHEAQNLKIQNFDKQHIYFGDIGYVLYIIIAFSIFGIKLSSLKFLYISIFLFTSILFMISYYKDNIYFNIFLIFLFSFILVLICNYGGSTEIFSLSNSRFITTLSTLPVLHLLFFILDKKKLDKLNLFLCFFQLTILLFICLVRGTAYIGLIFLIFVYLYSIFFKTVERFKKYSILTLIFFTFTITISGKILVNKNLSDLYKNDFARIKHTVWHNAFIGLSFYPKFHEEYVCSNTKLNDVLEIEALACGEYEKLFNKKKKFIKEVIYYKPRDIHGYTASINYLNQTGIKKNLGIKNDVIADHVIANLGIDWRLHEEIMKNLYFDAIVKTPLDFTYVTFILKPMKLIYEFLKFPIYFINAFKINTIFLILVTIALIFLYLISYKRLNYQNFSNSNKRLKISFRFILIYFVFNCAPSIIFYPSVGSNMPELIILLIILMNTKIKINAFKIR